MATNVHTTKFWESFGLYYKTKLKTERLKSGTSSVNIYIKNQGFNTVVIYSITRILFCLLIYFAPDTML